MDTWVNIFNPEQKVRGMEVLRELFMQELLFSANLYCRYYAKSVWEITMPVGKNKLDASLNQLRVYLVFTYQGPTYALKGEFYYEQT